MSTPQERMQNTQNKVRVNKSISLYTDSTQLGLIMRPVKIVTIGKNSLGPRDTVNVEQPAAASDKQKDSQGTQTVIDSSTNAQVKAGVDIQSSIGSLRAKLLYENNIRNSSNYGSEFEYGPMIQMPLPEKIKDGLKVNYSTADLGTTAAGALFGEDVANSFKNSTSVAGALTSNASYLVRTLLGQLSPGIAGVAQKIGGNIPNPFSAAIFEKVTPRSFNFSWTVQPQNAQESENLREIINVIRYWSLPNPSEERLILDVPYEWELSFVGTDFLYSFSRCVMTSLDVDYSPNGFNAFMKETSAPQSVTITIEFQEIYPLDKSTIDQSSASMKPSFVTGRATDFYEEQLRKQTAQDLKRELATLKSEKTKYETEVSSAQREYNTLQSELQIEKNAYKTASGKAKDGILNNINRLMARLETKSRELASAQDNLAGVNNEIQETENLVNQSGVGGG